MAQSIGGVIHALDQIIEDASERRSQLGYFAVLYRKVTLRVRAGIRDGIFDDGPRMERLDVLFANRYLEAFDMYSRGANPTASWRVAFEAADNPHLIILQHLFLGINAHVNLDLGIAVADVASGGSLDALKADFDRINFILSQLLDEVQMDIDDLSPWLGLLDWLAGRADEDFAEFSLGAARDHAWATATRLTAVNADEREAEVRRTDTYVAGLAQLITRGDPVTRLLIRLIQMRESKDVRRIIQTLG